MNKARKTGMVIVGLFVVIAITPSTAVADSLDSPDVGYETAFDGNGGSTPINTTEIGFNSTNEKLLVRGKSDNDYWTNKNQTAIYLDTDKDNTTGVTKDFVSDGTPRSAYYANLSDIGADYVVIAGGSSGNATYEWTGFELEKRDDVNVSVITGSDNSDDYVGIEVSLSNIGNSSEFNFKVAHIEDPDSVEDTSNFEFHPDPDNSEDRSLTYDTGIGLVGTTVQYDIVGSEKGDGYSDANVDITLVDDADNTITASETVNPGETADENSPFTSEDGVSSDDFNGGSGKLKAELTTDLSRYQLNTTSKSISDLSAGDTVEKTFKLEFIDPAVDFNVTTDTTPSDNYVEYDGSSTRFNATINLNNNTVDAVDDPGAVQTIENTITFEGGPGTEGETLINITDNPINTTGSIVNISDADGVDVFNKQFTATDNELNFYIRPINTSNGTISNGTIATVNFTTVEDPGYENVRNLDIEHTATVTRINGSDFRTGTVKNTSTINQSDAKVDVTQTSLVTQENMINGTLKVNATAESANDGGYKNITLRNTSGDKVTSADCSNVERGSTCTRTLSFTPNGTYYDNTSADELAGYNKTNITMNAYSETGTVAESNITDVRILKEGDVDPNGYVSIQDINAVKDDIPAEIDGGTFPYSNTRDALADTDNDGVVDSEDLSTVIENAY